VVWLELVWLVHWLGKSWLGMDCSIRKDGPGVEGLGRSGVDSRFGQARSGMESRFGQARNETVGLGQARSGKSCGGVWAGL